jgi:transcriptional regulator with XRE-family HTH domain
MRGLGVFRFSSYTSRMPAHADLGDRIRAARAELGWKQKHLAAEVRVEPITVSRWERGATTPDLETLRSVAQATGKPITYFVAGEEDELAALGGEDRVGRIEDALERIESRLGQLLESVERLEARGK